MLDYISHNNEIESLVQRSLSNVRANDLIATFSQIAYTVFKDIDPQATACGATHMLMQPFVPLAGFGKMLYDPDVQNLLTYRLLSDILTSVIDQDGLSRGREDAPSCGKNCRSIGVLRYGFPIRHTRRTRSGRILRLSLQYGGDGPPSS